MTLSGVAVLRKPPTRSVVVYLIFMQIAHKQRLKMRLRGDRFLTLYFFYPLMRILPKVPETRIPILMYHSISDDTVKNVHPYYETNTSPDVFSNQMR